MTDNLDELRKDIDDLCLEINDELDSIGERYRLDLELIANHAILLALKDKKEEK